MEGNSWTQAVADIELGWDSGEVAAASRSLSGGAAKS